MVKASGRDDFRGIVAGALLMLHRQHAIVVLRYLHFYEGDLSNKGGISSTWSWRNINLSMHTWSSNLGQIFVATSITLRNR